jgi:FKBP-type peptidyl-prolyl cis-trans isomerase FkpA
MPMMSARRLVTSVIAAWLVQGRTASGAAQETHQATVSRFPSGLEIQSITTGSGVAPSPNSTVVINYRASSQRLGQFDDSFRRGAPLEISLARSMPCWREALPMMRVGGHAVITCPPSLAYGETGTGTIPPNETITFEIWLLSVPREQ